MGATILQFIDRRRAAHAAAYDAHRVASRRSSLKCGDFVAMLETRSRTHADYVRVRNADRVADIASDQLFEATKPLHEALLRAMRLHDWVCAATHARYVEAMAGVVL